MSIPFGSGKTAAEPKTRASLVASLLTGAALTLPAVAAAQTASPPSATSAAEESSEGVQDIIVTATRRSESLQKVPISVIAVQGDTIAALGIKSTADLPQLAPGLTITRSGGVVPFIRGVGASNVGFTTESPVAIYLDGLYVANASSVLFGFNSIDRIEVLKGPQGTLYGRNSTGGLINVITRSPGDETRVDASVGYGNYDTFSTNFYGSTPITDNLAANISVVYSDQNDGWGKNNFTGNDVMKQKELGLLAKLLWRPGNDTKVELRGLYNYNSNNLGLATTLVPGAIGVDGTGYQGKYRSNTRQDPFSRLRIYSGSLKIEQDLHFANLMSLTGYTYARQPVGFTQSGIPGRPVSGQAAVEVAILGSGSTFTQELQLSSQSSGSPFKWIGGIFYLHDNTEVRLDSYGTCVGTVCAASPLPTRTTGRPTTRSISAYGEGTYDITEATHVTLGVRYTRDRKALTGLVEPLAGRPNSVTTLPASTVLRPGDPYTGNPGGIPTSVTASKVTFKGVIAQDFSDNVHGYLSFNRGFKSGGYNPISFTNLPSRPETLDAYEIGLKSELFDRMLRLNLSAFHYNYRDIQLRTTAPPAPPGGSILFNAARARSNGVDAEFSFVPSRSLTINGNLELLDAKYTSFPGGQCVMTRVIGGAVLGGSTAVPCDLSGARLVQSPKFSYNIGFVYTLETGAGRLALAANDGYKSRYSFSGDGRIQNAAFHLVNASLTWTSPNGRYDIQVYGKNLTGAYYYTAGQPATGGNDLYAPGAPRTYGVTAGVHF